MLHDYQVKKKVSMVILARPQLFCNVQNLFHIFFSDWDLPASQVPPRCANARTSQDMDRALHTDFTNF